MINLVAGNLPISMILPYFAHIPWEDTPDFPKPHKERNSETETVGEGSFWYLPGGPVGEILDYMHVCSY